ncbi:MAG: DNA primase [Elusimicrobia bacterium]|nr:DNA primase [Elusimicrobiota bacterium]
MARIGQDQLEAIRQRVDIAELVREYVPDLKRAGRSLKACCPFHQEKTPSFMVNLEKQIFHCFGCQEGGDAFAFLMKMENLSFVEAIEKLAQRAGITIARPTQELSAREREIVQLRSALNFAQEFYQRLLAQSPEAQEPRRYLESRGLSREVRDRFGLGFALPDGGSFLEAALRKGFSPEILSRAGLVTVVEKVGRYRDYFRGRILYPIRNVRGEVAGFGARAMAEAMPKYLNSPDTPLFTKGRVLYGLFEGLSDVRKSRRVILLEGYMDVLALHQFGLTNACAPLGTAVTPDHVALIKRYAEGVHLVFDPDDAGAAAALRGAELFLESGLSVRIVTLPRGLDPDELLHQEGRPTLERALQDSKDLPDFQTAVAVSRAGVPLSVESKDRIARSVLATIAKADSEVIKSEWLRRLAQRLGIDEESLRFQLARTSSAPGARPPFQAAPAGAASKIPPAQEAVSVFERALLKALFQSPSAVLSEDAIGEEDFDGAAARRIFSKLKEWMRNPSRQPQGSSSWSGAFLDGLDPEDARVVRALWFDAERKSPAQEERGLADLVEDRRLLKRYWALNARIEEMQRGQAPRDPDAIRHYNETLGRLNERRLMDRLRDFRTVGA